MKIILSIILIFLFSIKISSEELIPLDKYVERHKDSLTTDKVVFYYVATRCASIRSLYNAFAHTTNSKRAEDIKKTSQESFLRWAVVAVQIYKTIRPEENAENKFAELHEDLLSEYGKMANKNYTMQGTYIVGTIAKNGMVCKELEEFMFNQ